MMLGLLASHTAAQHAEHLLYEIKGASYRDHFAWAVAAGGDVDGDGCTDFIVGSTGAGTATLYSGSDGRVLWVAKPNVLGFGHAVAALGDVNRDGYPDFIASSVVWGDLGIAIVLSGKDGSSIHSVTGDGQSELFGQSVAGLGDIDNDGSPEFIVTAPKHGGYYYPNAGQVRVHSGRTGKVIYSLRGELYSELGWSVSRIGDVDRDSRDDYIVGSASKATIFSGPVGVGLRELNPAVIANNQGVIVAGAGDLDRDGYPDVIAACPSGGVPSGGIVVTYSGNTGKPINTFTAPEDAGRTLHAAGDINGDGYPDILIGTSAPNRGKAWVVDGRTGKILLTLFGNQVFGGADLNGDGAPDIITSVWRSNGVLSVLSGKELTLRSTNHRISRATGGQQTLEIIAGPQHADRPYWILGTMTGVRPGIRLPGVTIPLNPDPYTDLTIANVTSNPPFTGFRGKLDSDGRATATLTVPANLIADVTLHHAYVVYDNTGRLHMASNAASLRID